jgi:hypothetical protein
MKSLESIYNSILLENQNTTNTDIDLERLRRYIYGTPGKCTINDDGSIDVDGSVNISSRNLTKIPFKFRNVSGDFYCNHNKLKSLDGAPITVGDNFSCGCNHLTTLDGAPNIVGGSFWCHDNPEIPYSELFKIVDSVKYNIYYSSCYILEDKDKIRRDRDIKNVLKDDELGSLDV